MQELNEAIPVKEQEEWQVQAKEIAATLANNAALNKMLLSLAPAVREGVFRAIEPHLSFEARPHFGWNQPPRVLFRDCESCGKTFPGYHATGCLKIQE